MDAETVEVDNEDEDRKLYVDQWKLHVVDACSFSMEVYLPQ